MTEEIISNCKDEDLLYVFKVIKLMIFFDDNSVKKIGSDLAILDALKNIYFKRNNPIIILELSHVLGAILIFYNGDLDVRYLLEKKGYFASVELIEPLVAVFNVMLNNGENCQSTDEAFFKNLILKMDDDRVEDTKSILWLLRNHLKNKLIVEKIAAKNNIEATIMFLNHSSNLELIFETIGFLHEAFSRGIKEAISPKCYTLLLAKLYNMLQLESYKSNDVILKLIDLLKKNLISI